MPYHIHTCCWEVTPRPPPFTVLANIEMSNDDVSKSASCDGLSSDLHARLVSIVRPPPPFMLLAKSRESKDSQSSTDLLFDEPLMDAAIDLASDNWSRTGLNRSSRNWSTSEACDGTRTRLTCDADPKQKSTLYSEHIILL